MSDQPPQPPTSSRFTPQNKSTHERLSTNTVGLVALSDFRKRRAEVLEQQEREAREAAFAAARTNASTPDRSLTATPNNNNVSDSSEAERQRKKQKKRAKALVSFGDEEEECAPSVAPSGEGKKKKTDGGKAKEKEASKDGRDDAAAPAAGAESGASGGDGGDEDDADEGKDKHQDTDQKPVAKVAPNAAVGVLPRPLTKAARRREAAEREALRKEFLLLQAAIKATEIAIPFVFYDGGNIPGGIVRVKKGDFVWLFLDRSRKVGARLGVGSEKSANARRDWARVGVDDLMLVRGTIIIPHVSSEQAL